MTSPALFTRPPSNCLKHVLLSVQGCHQVKVPHLSVMSGSARSLPKWFALSNNVPFKTSDSGSDCFLYARLESHWAKVCNAKIMFSAISQLTFKLHMGLYIKLSLTSLCTAVYRQQGKNEWGDCSSFIKTVQVCPHSPTSNRQTNKWNWFHPSNVALSFTIYTHYIDVLCAFYLQ